MTMKFEQLETRIAFNVGPVAPPGLDIDSPVLQAPVYGPEIPDNIGYIPPPALMRPEAINSDDVSMLQGYIRNNEPRTDLTHPIGDGFINREYIWDNDLQSMFAAYASDGEITTREARDLVVSNDDGGYISRFEVFQTINYIYDEDYQSLYNTASQVFMVNMITDFNFEWSSIGVDAEAPYLREGIESIQPVADYWWNVTQQVEGNTNVQANNGETGR